jgi:hypothetical protein
MHAWQRRRIDLTKLLKNACGILFQMRINAKPFPLTSLADLADGVTVVPFHPKHAQWVKDRVNSTWQNTIGCCCRKSDRYTLLG